MENLANIVAHFNIVGDVAEIKPLGNGLINTTYKVKTASPDTPDYVLQHINNSIFPNVEMLMDNIIAVTTHIRKKLEAAHTTDIDRKVLTFVPAKDNTYFYFDGEKYWRIMVFIPDAVTKTAVTPESSYEVGRTFGNFQAMLADIPVELGETIKDFHNMEFRLQQMREAVAEDKAGRMQDAEVKEFRYDGKRYTDKQVPLDVHRSYLEALLEKAKAINEAVYRYLWNHAENPSALKGAYESLFYIPDFQAEYAPLRDAFDLVADELDRLTQEEVEKDKQRYINELQRCESALRQLIGHLRRDLLESIVQEAYLDQLADYARETHLSVLDINWKAAKEMWHIIEALEDIHNQLEATANQQIREELKRYFRNAGS